jgi:hypothetical protein
MMARDGQPRRPRATENAITGGIFVQVAVLASVALIGAGWGLVRYYTHPRLPMLVPAPPDAGAVSEWGDAAVIPAPEIELAH